jgi:hopanoid biosynthesis associated RND transporter like protein HpnN
VGERVKESIEQRLGGWVAAVVAAAVGRPFATVLLVLAAAGASLGYAVTNLGIHGDTESLFDEELTFKRLERRYYEAFPTLYETMFVVVDAATPERAGEAASAMASRLRRERGHFHRVYLPGGGDFFETHAFLYRSTAELQDLADRLAEVQPYLAELSRDRSIRGLASIMGRGARAVREGDVAGAQLVPMFERFSEALDAAADGRSYQLSWAEVLAGDHFDDHANQRFLLVQPVLDHASLQPAKRAITKVRAVAGELGLTPDTGVTVRITGDVALSAEELETVRTQAALAGVASLVLVGAILVLGLRSLRLVLATLLTLVVGLVLTAGFAAVFVGHLNMISVCFAVLFIGLGVDFGIHFCTRYRELLTHGREHQRALDETARDVGSSVALCAVTTAIGFFAFVPTDFVGVAELGLIAGMGMFVSLACTIVLLPALLSLPPEPKGSRESDGVTWGDGGLAALPLRHARLVRGAALALGAGAVLLLPKARFDNNPLNVRDPSSESVRTFAELLERGSSSPWSLNAVAPGLDSAETLAAELRRLDVVERVVTVSDFIPSDQDEKLDIIGDVAMFLAPLPGPDGVRGAASTAEKIDSLRTLAVEVRRLRDEGAPNGLDASAGRLHRSLAGYLAEMGARPDPGPALDALAESVVGSLPEQLRVLEAALGAGRVTLENLPDALLETLVASDGRVRVQIFPRDDLNDHAALAHFVDGVRGVVPDVAGSAAEVLESGRAVVRALRQALLSAVLAITAMLFLLWRSWNDAALVLLPLGLAAAFTVAASVLLDIPFNFADVIVLPLLLGIGVDSGIHLVHRARVGQVRDASLLGTSTARAVAYSAATTIASFGTMGFASHLGLATLGQLLTLGVAFTIVCNLIVLPSLIVLRAERRGVAAKERAVTPSARTR